MIIRKRLTMEDSNKNILLEVLTEIFEEFAFVFLEEESDDGAPPDDDALLAEIGFSSSRRSGKLILAASRSLCSEVAENVLGEEDQENLPWNASRNALQELVNIACGNILARLYGTKENFELSVPSCLEISAEQWRRRLGGEGAIFLSAEGEPIGARLTLDKGKRNI